MAYPVDWIDPKHDWVSNDGIANTDLNRSERNTDLLGEAVFGNHLEESGVWYTLVNPNYYMQVAAFDVNGNGIAAAGTFDHVKYMQINNTIFMRGLIQTSIITAPASGIAIVMAHPPILNHDYMVGVPNACGNALFKIANERYPGVAKLESIGLFRYVFLYLAWGTGQLTSNYWDIYFDVCYPLAQRFAQVYNATTTSTTTAEPTTTTAAP
jgi:hypothetical protein